MILLTQSFNFPGTDRLSMDGAQTVVLVPEIDRS